MRLPEWLRTLPNYQFRPRRTRVPAVVDGMVELARWGGHHGSVICGSLESQERTRARIASIDPGAEWDAANMRFQWPSGGSISLTVIHGECGFSGLHTTEWWEDGFVNWREDEVPGAWS